jgi:hypothetical protein
MKEKKMNNEVLTQKEAETVIAVLRKQGITTRVTKVAADLYVVKAETVLPEQKSEGREAQEKRLEEVETIPVSSEEMKVEDGASAIPDQETVLPEEKAAEEEEELPPLEEGSELFESEASARKEIAVLRRDGVWAALKKVGGKFAILVRSEDIEKLDKR